MITSNKIYLIITILTTLGCSHKQIAGTYVYKDKQVIHSLQIENDKSFSYLVQSDVGSGRTTGKWQFESPFLYLASYDSNKFFEIKERDSAGLEYCMIDIEDISNLGSVSGYVLFNLDTTKYFFEKNRLSVPVSLKNFTSFQIHTFEKIETYTRQSPSTNFIAIKYASQNGIQKWYINDTLRLENRKLIGPKFPVLQKK